VVSVVCTSHWRLLKFLHFAHLLKFDKGGMAFFDFGFRPQMMLSKQAATNKRRMPNILPRTNSDKFVVTFLLGAGKLAKSAPGKAPINNDILRYLGGINIASVVLASMRLRADGNSGALATTETSKTGNRISWC
jgi:hypothetical protein